MKARIQELLLWINAILAHQEGKTSEFSSGYRQALKDVKDRIEKEHT